MHAGPLEVVRRLCLATLFFVLFVSAREPARAQSTATEIVAQLKDKPLFLRGFWKQDDLGFTHEGKPVQPYAPGPFTLAGIDVDGARFSGDTLEIKGHRVGLEFDPKGGSRRVRLNWRDYSGQIKLRIAGHSGEDFGPALAAIFAPDLQTLVPSPRIYWARVGEEYLKGGDLDQAIDDAADEAAEKTLEAAVGPGPANEAESPSAPRAVAQPAEPSAKPLRVGESVKAPAVLSTTEPTFSDAARGMRYSGKVKVSLRVELSGVPSHLQVERPAGLGLDERALAATAAYRFKPATKDGQPVAVQIWVEVNFQVF